MVFLEMEWEQKSNACTELKLYVITILCSGLRKCLNLYFTTTEICVITTLPSLTDTVKLFQWSYCWKKPEYLGKKPAA